MRWSCRVKGHQWLKHEVPWIDKSLQDIGLLRLKLAIIFECVACGHIEVSESK